MKCPICSSDNVNVQISTETELKTKHHSIWYWLIIGWWLHLILWLFLTLPMILGKLFGRKNQKIVTKQKSIAVCQNCGNHWEITNK